MTKRKVNTETDMQNIQEDILSLKENMISLTRHVQENGAHRLSDAGKKIREHVEDAQTTGLNELQKIEGRVQEKPGQSMLLAFCAGLAVSRLMKGASSRRSI